jgi:hypothetical protein
MAGVGVWIDWMNICIRWVRSLFAWSMVRNDGPWAYYENRVTGQRRCRWDGTRYSHVDYDFIRPGDIVEGPFGREVVPEYGNFAPAFKG